MKGDRLDDFFRNKLENERVPVDPKQLRAFEQLLNEEAAPKRGSSRLRWALIALLSLLSIFLFWKLATAPSKQNPFPTIVKNVPNGTENNQKTESEAPSYPKDQASTKTQVESGNKPANDPTQNNNSLNEQTEKASTPNSGIQERPIVDSNELVQNALRDKRFQPNPILNDSLARNRSNNVPGGSSETINIPVDYAEESSRIILQAVPEIMRLQLKVAAQKERPGGESLPIFFNNLMGPEPDLTVRPNESVITPVQPNKVVHWNVTASGLMYLQNTSDTKQFIGYQIGFRTQRRLNEQLTWNTGLSYQQRSGTLFDSTVVSRRYSFGLEESTTTLSLRNFHSLQLPIQLNYRRAPHVFQAGISANWLFAIEGERTNSLESSPVRGRVKLGDVRDFRTEFRLGYGLQLSSKLDAILGWNWQLNTIFIDNPQRYLEDGVWYLDLGLNYKF